MSNMFGEDARGKVFKGGIKGLGKGLSGSASKGKLGHGSKVTSGGKEGGRKKDADDRRKGKGAKDRKGCK